MKKWLTAAAALLLTFGTACAQNTYVFPYEGLRYTCQEGETVLTQTNLEENAELLASLGTNPDAVLASYVSSGIVMEILPENGGQIAVSVLNADGVSDVKELAESFSNSGMYEECELRETQPESVRLTSSAAAGSMMVYTLRYAVVHMDHIYMFTKTIVGRVPDETDNAEIEDLLSRVRLLDVIAEPTASPTAKPAATPEPEPVPTPGAAEAQSVTGNIAVDEIPSVVTSETLTVTGTVDPAVEVILTVGGTQAGRTIAGTDGRFSAQITLPEVGENALQITAGEASASYVITYEIPGAALQITEPEVYSFTGSGVTVRGITEPGATVYVNGKGNNVNVKANRSGVFSVRIAMNRPGTEDFTIRAHLKGYTDTETTITLTREMTEREKIADFRSSMVTVTYENLCADPAAYAGKSFSLRGKIMTFADYNGSPSALVCVSNPSTGIWRDPVWVVLADPQSAAEGNVVTFYMTGEGITLPADGAYTSSGKEEEAPVVREVSFK